MNRTVHVSGSLVLLLLAAVCQPVTAGTIRVPQEHPTIQAAIDAAATGDTVLVNAGTYRERLRLKPDVTLLSAGNNEPGETGLRRAERTIIDGGGKAGTDPGVMLAEGAVLDGFTITGVGQYDEAMWKKHFATHGEEQSHEHIGEFGTPGIGISGSCCTVRNNIVHHNGFTGIAIQGVEGRPCSPLVTDNVCYRNMGGGIGSVEKSTAVIQRNICFENFYAGIGHDNASPLVLNNTCYGNVRAGIGISEGACPVVRGNKCYGNRRAGIGIRSGGNTQPVVEQNECYENAMAGIGNREEARPIIRHNRCYRNLMAGIGSRDGAAAVIEHNECFENRMSGIGCRLEASPVIRHNRCYRNVMAGIGAREKARPVIEDNECFENGMAGIGSQEEAAPVIRGNRCYQNRMAGIGSRTGARPVIVENECFHNEQAGIGSQEGAIAVICRNRTYRNRQAGIGSRSGARTIIVENESRENDRAGIGVREGATALIAGNRCLENRLVAIGLPDGATALIHGNQLQRTAGGGPPLVAIRGGSRAVLSHNRLAGGGIAAVLVQGQVHLDFNQFQGRGKGQGAAVQAADGSTLAATGNQFDGYRTAINASGSQVTAAGNYITRFEGTAITVRRPSAPARLFGNTAISEKPEDQVFQVVDGEQAADGNTLQSPDEAAADRPQAPALWPLPDDQPAPAAADGTSPRNESPRSLTVQDGPWKLVATFGETTVYRLYNTEEDRQEKHDLSARLENIVFRLRGLLEHKAAVDEQPAPPGAAPGPPRKQPAGGK